MLSLLLAVTLAAASPKVASPEWNVVDVKPELARFYADNLAQALRQAGLEVMTAQDISTLLSAERQRQLTGCAAEKSCLAELANALGCDATLTVSLARLDGGFRGLLKVLSSRDGHVLSAVKVDARSERELLDALDRAAPELARPLLAPRRGSEPAPSARRGWWLPSLLGVAGLGGGAAMFVLAGTRYGQLVDATSLGDARLVSGQGLTFQTAAWVSTSVGAAALLAGLGLLVFGEPEAPVAVSLTGNGVVFSGAW